MWKLKGREVTQLTAGLCVCSRVLLQQEGLRGLGSSADPCALSGNLGTNWETPLFLPGCIFQDRKQRKATQSQMYDAMEDSALSAILHGLQSSGWESVRPFCPIVGLRFPWALLWGALCPHALLPCPYTMSLSFPLQSRNSPKPQMCKNFCLLIQEKVRILHCSHASGIYRDIFLKFRGNNWIRAERRGGKFQLPMPGTAQP